MQVFKKAAKPLGSLLTFGIAISQVQPSSLEYLKMEEQQQNVSIL